MVFASSFLNAQNCVYNEITLELTTGDWASEVSWSITDTNGITIDTCNQSYLDYTLYTDTLCLEDGCYNFNMYDSYGDGCNYYDLKLVGFCLDAGLGKPSK